MRSKTLSFAIGIVWATPAFADCQEFRGHGSCNVCASYLSLDGQRPLWAVTSYCGTSQIFRHWEYDPIARSLEVHTNAIGAFENKTVHGPNPTHEQRFFLESVQNSPDRSYRDNIWGRH